jgi:hypothetical protein
MGRKGGRGFFGTDFFRLLLDFDLPWKSATDFHMGRHAVVIGIGRYADPQLTDVPRRAADAVKLAGKLPGRRGKSCTHTLARTATQTDIGATDAGCSFADPDELLGALALRPVRAARVVGGRTGTAPSRLPGMSP